MSSNDFFKYLLLGGGGSASRSELESETLPYTFVSKSQRLRNYRIYGNTVNGVSVGNRTKNLFNGNLYSGSITSADGADYPADISVRSGYINVEPDTTYTVSLIRNNSPAIVKFIGFYTSNNRFSYITPNTGSNFTFTTPLLTNRIRIIFRKTEAGENITPEYFDNIKTQLEKNDSATSYEPYGYRIPIVINEHSTNIYLSAPLTKAENNADYIDYKTQKRHNADGTVENVTLPEIDVFDNENEISFGTTVQPSKVYLQGNISEIETVSAQSLQASPQTLDLQPLSLDVMPIDKDEFQINDISEMSVEEIPETENLETTGDEENAE